MQPKPQSRTLCAYLGSQVHTLYADMKKWACCRTLDTVGNTWFALWLATCAAIPLGIVLIIYIAALDKLPPAECALPTLEYPSLRS